MTLVFIRHGATGANAEHRYLGKTDESLSAEGISELKAYKKQGIYPRIDCLFASPMKRCLETAQILYPAIQPIVIPEWEETDFGQFEYKNYEELKDDPAYQAWIDSSGMLPFPGGESREAFLIRCESGFVKMREKLCRVSGEADMSLKTRISEMADVTVTEEVSTTVGIIVHGGTIMALLSEHCGNDYYDYQVRNGCGYICKMNRWKNEVQINNLQRLESLGGNVVQDLKNEESV